MYQYFQDNYHTELFSKRANWNIRHKANNLAGPPSPPIPCGVRYGGYSGNPSP